MDKGGQRNSQKGRPGWITTLLICLGVLLLGAGVTAFIFSTEPTATREGATRESAMLVEVTQVQRGTFRPTIIAMGTVVPARDIILSPRVGGQIIERSPDFTPGGYIAAGDTLLRIDPADFENVLRQRQSDLQQALADLNIEMGRQKVARKDYQLLDQTLAEANEALVLRRPQLKAARARVAASRAAVAQAELDLQRTRIKAPFDAHILSRNVNLGSQVAPGDNLGRLVGLDTYWVEVTVPLVKLRWLVFPEKAGVEGSQVRIRDRSAWPAGQYRLGRMYRLVGALEDRTRMARVLVTVDDPLGHRGNSADVPPLIIGAFVETRIQARQITDIVRLRRDFVRAGDTVWVMLNGELDIRKVGVVFRDATYAYIDSGLRDTDQVVTTNLSTVVDGAKLRTVGADAAQTESRKTSTDGRATVAGGRR
jgi:RND family efflux transporter MFP subunit